MSNNEQILNVRRKDILYREDIQQTAFYAVIGVTAVAVFLSVGYLVIQQLRK